MDKKAAAAERYRQAVELDPTFCEACNNLWTVLAELGEVDESLEAYRRALVLDPHYGDAHYNLADTLDSVGRADDALSHWRAYLKQDISTAPGPIWPGVGWRRRVAVNRGELSLLATFTCCFFLFKHRQFGRTRNHLE